MTPGMTATVEIRTNSRRVIDYLLSPWPNRIRGLEGEVDGQFSLAFRVLGRER